MAFALPRRWNLFGARGHSENQGETKTFRPLPPWRLRAEVTLIPGDGGKTTLCHPEGYACDIVSIDNTRVTGMWWRTLVIASRGDIAIRLIGRRRRRRARDIAKVALSPFACFSLPFCHGLISSFVSQRDGSWRERELTVTFLQFDANEIWAQIGFLYSYLARFSTHFQTLPLPPRPLYFLFSFICKQIICIFLTISVRIQIRTCTN